MQIMPYIQSFTWACGMLLVGAAASAGEGTTSRPAPEAAARQFLAIWRTASTSHDRSAYRAMLAGDGVMISRYGAVKTTHELAAEPAEIGEEPEESLSEPVDVRAWRAGSLLFFTYRSIETIDYGQQRERLEYRGSFVVRESDGGSQIVLYQATPVPNAQRQAAQIDPAIYDRYVGEYSAGLKDHVFITREGDRLIVTISGDRHDMTPSDNTTFFVPGWPDDWVFVSNAQGQVLGLETRHWGQNILAKKIH
jgi:hypothetical protein